MNNQHWRYFCACEEPFVDVYIYSSGNLLAFKCLNCNETLRIEGVFTQCTQNMEAMWVRYIRAKKIRKLYKSLYYFIL